MLLWTLFFTLFIGAAGRDSISFASESEVSPTPGQERFSLVDEGGNSPTDLGIDPHIDPPQVGFDPTAIVTAHNVLGLIFQQVHRRPPTLVRLCWCWIGADHFFYRTRPAHVSPPHSHGTLVTLGAGLQCICLWALDRAGYGSAAAAAPDNDGTACGRPIFCADSPCPPGGHNTAAPPGVAGCRASLSGPACLGNCASPVATRKTGQTLIGSLVLTTLGCPVAARP